MAKKAKASPVLSDNARRYVEQLKSAGENGDAVTRVQQAMKADKGLKAADVKAVAVAYRGGGKVPATKAAAMSSISTRLAEAVRFTKNNAIAYKARPLAFALAALGGAAAMMSTPGKSGSAMAADAKSATASESSVDGGEKSFHPQDGGAGERFGNGMSGLMMAGLGYMIRNPNGPGTAWQAGAAARFGGGALLLAGGAIVANSILGGTAKASGTKSDNSTPKGPLDTGFGVNEMVGGAVGSTIGVAKGMFDMHKSGIGPGKATLRSLPFTVAGMAVGAFLGSSSTANAADGKTTPAAAPSPQPSSAAPNSPALGTGLQVASAAGQAVSGIAMIARQFGGAGPMRGPVALMGTSLAAGVVGAYLNSSAKAKAAETSATPSRPRAGGVAVEPASRTAYMTIDGRTVQATERQAEAFRARRQNF